MDWYTNLAFLFDLCVSFQHSPNTVTRLSHNLIEHDERYTYDNYRMFISTDCISASESSPVSSSSFRSCWWRRDRRTTCRTTSFLSNWCRRFVVSWRDGIARHFFSERYDRSVSYVLNRFSHSVPFVGQMILNNSDSIPYRSSIGRLKVRLFQNWSCYFVDSSNSSFCCLVCVRSVRELQRIVSVNSIRLFERTHELL